MENFIDESPKSIIYALYDVVAKSNVQYFDSCNDETAIRLVKDIARDPKSFLYKHRNDLQLYRLFEYAPKTGEQVFNRTMIYSLSALPSYDDLPYGFEALKDQIQSILTHIALLDKNEKLVAKLQHDNERLIKQGNVSFIDKLFKNNRNISEEIK